MRSDRFVLLIAALIVALAILGGAIMILNPGTGPFSGARQAAVGNLIGGPFALIDHTGRAVNERDYRGRYLLVFFGYTYCPDVCPTTLQEIATTLDLLGTEASGVAPLFISVDPERDTPEVLRAYVAAFDPRITGLTGSVEQVKDVAKIYRAYFAKAKAGEGPYLMDHSSIVYLMGPDGTYLTHFTHATSPENMASRIRAHSKEK